MDVVVSQEGSTFTDTCQLQPLGSRISEGEFGVCERPSSAFQQLRSQQKHLLSSFRQQLFLFVLSLLCLVYDSVHHELQR